MKREWEEVYEVQRKEQQEKREILFLDLVEKLRTENLDTEKKTWELFNCHVIRITMGLIKTTISVCVINCCRVYHWRCFA